jgi:hypothetical protein
VNRLATDFRVAVLVGFQPPVEPRIWFVYLDVAIAHQAQRHFEQRHEDKQACGGEAEVLQELFEASAIHGRLQWQLKPGLLRLSSRAAVLGAPSNLAKSFAASCIGFTVSVTAQMSSVNKNGVRPANVPMSPHDYG